MMDTVSQLKPGQSLIVKSTFNPRPLISQMWRRGYLVTQEKMGKVIMTTFVPTGTAPAGDNEAPTVAAPIEGREVFLDNRGL